MLQQMTTLKPFVRKPIVLPAIAGLAGNYNIPFIVTTPLTGDRNDVVNAIAFSKFLLTIVAPAR
jgi:hypothetical protein